MAQPKTRTQELLAQASTIHARSRTLVAETLVVVELARRNVSSSCLKRIDRILASWTTEDNTAIERRASDSIASLESVLEDSCDACSACAEGLYDG